MYDYYSLIHATIVNWFSVITGPNHRFNPLTLGVSLEGIVCYFGTFGNNLWIKQRSTKYLKERCCLAFDKHFSFKRFQENAFVSKIFPK